MDVLTDILSQLGNLDETIECTYPFCRHPRTDTFIAWIKFYDYDPVEIKVTDYEVAINNKLQLATIIKNRIVGAYLKLLNS